jgi:hypothetical protein
MLVCFVLLRSFCKRFPASMGGFGKGLQAVNSQFTPRSRERNELLSADGGERLNSRPGFTGLANCVVNLSRILPSSCAVLEARVRVRANP